MCCGTTPCTCSTGPSFHSCHQAYDNCNKNHSVLGLPLLTAFVEKGANCLLTMHCSMCLLIVSYNTHDKLGCVQKPIASQWHTIWKTAHNLMLQFVTVSCKF